MISHDVRLAFIKLKASRSYLNRHQYSTIKGQINSGDIAGAIKGMERLKEQSKRKKA